MIKPVYSTAYKTKLTVSEKEEILKIIGSIKIQNKRIIYKLSPVRI